MPVDLQRLRVASLRHKGEPGQHHPDPASSSLGVVRSLQKMCRHERMRMTTDRSSNTHKASAQRTQVLRSDDCLFVNSSTVIRDYNVSSKSCSCVSPRALSAGHSSVYAKQSSQKQNEKNMWYRSTDSLAIPNEFSMQYIVTRLCSSPRATRLHSAQCCKC